MAAMTEMNNNGEEPIENAEEVIERFGGIRPMASKMDVPVTTVQGWKKRNVIPGNRRDEVMEAAASNDVDLSDLISEAANENHSESSAADEADTFDEEVMAAGQHADEKSAARHEETAFTAERRLPESEDAEPRPSPSSADLKTANEAMLAQLREAQNITFNKSAWFSVGLVTFVVIIAAVALWPTKKQIETNTGDIAALESDMTEMQEGQSFLRGLIPDDLEERFGLLTEQTQQVQESVTALSAEVETIAKDVTAPNLSMAERVQRIEEHAARLGAPEQLTLMLQKIKGMQQSLEGQTQLSSAIAELNMLFDSAQENDQDIEQALMQAQQEDDALGFALENVAQQDLKAAALLLGLSQFRDSLHRNAPFEEDLALMQKMLGENDPELQAAITRLAPKAESGVLTPEGLKGEFQGLAGDIVVASLKGEDVSVQERTRARFNDLLSVEKDGELLTGTDTQAAVARTQKMLDDGNIQGAIAELQSLEGEAAQTAQPFIDEAQLTLLAEQVQGAFTSKTMNVLGGSGLSFSGDNMSQLLNEIKKLAPPRKVIRDEESGFSILEPQPKLRP